jgi:hypothetical protein
MLDEEQEIADAPGAPVLDERVLELERFGVRHDAKMPDFNCAHRLQGRTHASAWADTRVGRYMMPASQFSSACLTFDMNSSATAPSITR